MSPVFESPSGLVSEVVYQTLPPWVTPWWGVGGTRLTYGRIPCVVSVLKPTYLYLTFKHFVAFFFCFTGVNDKDSDNNYDDEEQAWCVNDLTNGSNLPKMVGARIQTKSEETSSTVELESKPLQSSSWSWPT